MLMSKKTLSLILLASLTLGLASCKSKKSDSPVVPDNNNTGTVDNNLSPATPPTGPIKVDVNAAESSNASIRLKGPTGASVTINKKDYTIGANGFIGIDDVPAKLEVSSDDLTELLINKKALPWVTQFVFQSPSVSAKNPITIDLAGLTGVKNLQLLGVRTSGLDLTPLKELEQLNLGTSSKNSAFTGVKLASNNKIRRLVARSPFTDADLDLSKFPALTYARFMTPKFTSVAFPNSPKLETLVIDRPSGGHNSPFTLDLSANTQLVDLSLRDAHLTKLTIKNNQVLDISKSNIQNSYADAYELDGMVEATKQALIAKITKK